MVTKAELRKAKRADGTKKPTKKKPKDKPKRPRSAYNYFFQQERQRILGFLARDKSIQMEPVVDEGQEKRLIKETGKVSFEEMGKIIGSRWKNLPNERLSKFTELALGDTERYKKEMVVYNKKQDDAATQAMKAQAENASRAAAGGANAGGPIANPYGGAQGNLYGAPYGVPGMGYNMPGGNMAFPGMQMGGYPNPNYPGGYAYPYQQYYGNAAGGAYPQGTQGAATNNSAANTASSATAPPSS